jgi:transcriptional regulator with XRE-family HTH domain
MTTSRLKLTPVEVASDAEPVKPRMHTGMSTTSLPGSTLTLGGFLRDRRERLAPAPGGVSRRRTPGLRREEVAARAGVSVTWYTWLEQGRGGPPSDEALERLAEALELDAAGREALFLLAQQRPPPLEAAAPVAVPESVQRMIDAWPTSPAVVRTMTWDVVAWNAAALAVLGDYRAVPSRERNVLRRLFLDPVMRTKLDNWEADARFVVSAFRMDIVRACLPPEAAALADELQATSSDFRRLWAENELRSHGVGRKRLKHPTAGWLTLDYSALSVDGANGLGLVVYTAATPEDARAIERLLQ